MKENIQKNELYFDVYSNNARNEINDNTNKKDVFGDVIKGFSVDLKNGSILQQSNSISFLRIIIMNYQISVKEIGDGILEDIMCKFVQEKTDIFIKISLLKLIETMFDVNTNFVREFCSINTGRRIYDVLFNEMIDKNSLIPLVNLLTLIDYLNIYSLYAHSYFYQNGFLGFIFKQIQCSNNENELGLLLTSLQKFMGSKCSERYSNDDLTKIAKTLLGIILPNFFAHQTSTIVPVIRILTLLFEKSDKGNHIKLIEDSKITAILITIINSDNLELAVSSISFLAIASVHSDVICLQLELYNVLGLSRVAIDDEKIFQTCSISIIQMIYSTIVACSSKDSNYSTLKYHLPENKCFVQFLNKIFKQRIDVELINKGLFLLGLIVNHYPTSELIPFIQLFELDDLLQSNIEAGPSDGATGSLTILYKIFSALTVAPFQSAKKIKEELFNEDMADALLTYKEMSESDELKNVTSVIINWINKKHI